MTVKQYLDKTVINTRKTLWLDGHFLGPDDYTNKDIMNQELKCAEIDEDTINLITVKK